MNIMAAYDIQDAASYLAAVRTVNRKYYALNSKLVENERTLHEVELRLKTWSEYEERKVLYRRYRALPARRQTAFYEKHDIGQHRINDRIQIGGHAFCENQQDALCICSQGRTDSSCQAGPVSQNQIR